eukprot:TRINITY_DN6070_c0_g1_i1.p1 TRINITY_DN6070_c0_g1~~TRINITY_DN6070_c0_g1_i1.p1  ORF type:complete len:246 (-),score=28.98 TRINITY_DN6070_c0_g1_i1:165-902(-)
MIRLGLQKQLMYARKNRVQKCKVLASNNNGNGVLPYLTPLDNSYEDSMSFSAYCNWVMEGRLMLGRYPYVEPSRCTDLEQGKKQLEAILAQGIDTFICLQAELPSQKQLSFNGSAGFLPYAQACEDIALSMDSKRDILFVHEPIIDLSIPSQQQMTGLVDNMIQLLQNDRNIYLHCWGGRGRAGTAGACLISQLYGLSSVEALTRIQRAFDTRKDGGRSSPETDQQKNFVKEYVAGLSAVSQRCI